MRLQRILVAVCLMLPWLTRADEPVTMRVTTTGGGVSEYSLERIESVEFTSQPASAQGSLQGKKIGYNGDSIFTGIFTGANTNGGAPAHIIAALTGSEYENRAHHGASVARTGGERHNVVDDVQNMAADLDLICFEGGVNDFWINVPLGEMTGPLDFSGPLDETTYLGALESVFRQAIERWPGKPIVFVIPHKIEGAYGRLNKLYEKYDDFTEGARRVCRKYGVPYVDGEATFNLNGELELHRNRYFLRTDGIHPNEEGYRRYWVGPMIALFESLLR